MLLGYVKSFITFIKRVAPLDFKSESSSAWFIVNQVICDLIIRNCWGIQLFN